MSRSQATPFPDLQQVYLQLAQYLQQKNAYLSLSRLELLTRQALLHMVLTRALEHTPRAARQHVVGYYQHCLSSIVGPDLFVLQNLQADNFYATVALQVDNALAGASIPADLLGRLYEKSLAYSLSNRGQGLAIHVDQGARQREGSYYTPLPLVSFILEKTVGSKIETWKKEVTAHLRAQRYAEGQNALVQLAALKVLDISCGSGAFLLHACLLLCEAYKWWNQQVEGLARTQRTWLEQEKELQVVPRPLTKALQQSIFGVDRDAEAVAVARISLVLMQVQKEGVCEDTLLDSVDAHMVVADALISLPNMSALCGDVPQRRIIIGNPPWGAIFDKAYSQHYALAKGQYDSYELFIEQATRWLRSGDMLGYVVPDSLLHLPQHAHIRRYLLQHYQIEALMKVGEGVFDGVFRGVVVFSAIKNEQITADHTIQCRVMVKAERKDMLQQLQSLQGLFANGAISVPQVRLLHNKDSVFDLYACTDDEIVLHMIEEQHMDWQEVMTTGRGVEIAKSGMIMQCCFCGRWQNIPRKQKNGIYPPKSCVNCARTIIYKDCQQETIINNTPIGTHSQPIIIGEDLHRYRISALRYIDISKGGEINYKTPELYSGEKLLVRKTGRGIYATIDRTGAYTNQVVFIFKLKPERPLHLQPVRLSYILGVLNSRMMLYYYYKIFGDIEWKSFPYMTQRTIMRLPIRCIDFNDTGQALLHEKIAGLVDAVLAEDQCSFVARDEQIEHAVRTLYGVHTAETSQRIDKELQRISAYGPLLGSKR